MSLFARFQAINENDKAAVVRKLMQNSTPNFDFFYLSGLATLMATLGLLIDSPSVVIGSMLIAPVLYPILGIALGLVMSDGPVLARSFVTLTKSFAIGLGIAVIATLLLGHEASPTNEILARAEPSLVYFIVAVVAGLAVSYALAQPEWSETLPGIAVSVALIPPLAALGAGAAMLDLSIVSGSVVLLTLNVVGIIFAAMVSFSLMNLYEKRGIAESTIKREDKRMEAEQAAIEEVQNHNGEHESDEVSKDHDTPESNDAEKSAA